MRLFVLTLILTVLGIVPNDAPATEPAAHAPTAHVPAAHPPAAHPPAAHPPAEHKAGAEEAARAYSALVFACDFSAAVDADYDAWPDGWTRRRGRSYPDFLKIEIVAEEAAAPAPDEVSRGQTPPARLPADQPENYALQIKLNGGGAVAASPLLTVSPLYSFELEGGVKTAGLKHTAAWLSLSFYAADGRLLETYDSPPLSGTTDWQRLRVGPVTPRSPDVRQACISLHVEPLDRHEDLVGSACFDDLKLERLPRMTLVANSETGLYSTPRGAEIACEVAGIVNEQAQLQFELYDHRGALLAEHRSPLQMQSPAFPARRVAAGRHAEAEQAGCLGRATWKPPLPDFGFYRVHVSLLAADEPKAIGGPTPAAQPKATTILQRSLSLAVVRPLPLPAQGEFGWSLPAADKPLPMGAMTALLGEAGINWIKLPVWFSDRDVAQADHIAWFAERLSISGIQTVGVLDQPPRELREVFREKGRLPVASIFIEPELWQPVVDPVMTRLSLKVRWWQLGDDADASFVGFPQAAEKVAEVKQHLERFGQETRVGVSWRWLYEPPATKNPPWAFLSYGSEPALTAAELADYLKLPPPPPPVAKAPARSSLGAAQLASTSLAARPAPKSAQRWVVLSPLPAGEYSLSARAQDLVTRMLAAKIQGADAVFVPRPFDDQEGLCSAAGAPGELLLPWRTTALMLAGAEYLGQFQLPGGSTNHVFARDGRAVMMIWNSRPKTETLYLGDDIRQIDLWGRETVPPTTQDEGFTHQQVTVGPLPTFLVGVYEPIARWQIGVEFENPRLASLFGRPQAIRLKLRNPFAQGVGGELKLVVPRSWESVQQVTRFKIAEQSDLQQDLLVNLQADANSGPQQVRLDFELAADRNYRFSVYRTLQLGLDDVLLEMNTRLRSDGSLLVEQHLTNFTDAPLNFQSTLFPPGRRREMKQILNLSRGRTTLSFVLPNGEELIGQKLWLRCEEISGSRVLNYTVIGER